MILSFYAIVAGWMLGFAASYPLSATGMASTGDWLVNFGSPRNLTLMLVFMVLTMAVVLGGVEHSVRSGTR